MIHFLVQLSRKNKQSLLMLFDVIAIITSIFASFSIRLGYFYFPADDNHLILLILAAPVLALLIFSHFELYRTVIRYASLKSLWLIIQATALYAMIWGLFAFMASNWEAFPRSVIIINWLLVLIIIGGARFFARWVLSGVDVKSDFSIKDNVLIYGAGSAGRQLSRALSDMKGYKPIAFLDDSIELYDQYIEGLKVYSQDDLEDLIKKNNIKEVLLAIPSVSRSRRREIISLLEPFSLVVRTLPSLSALAKGKVKINDLLEIDIRDILSRDYPISNNSLLKKNIFNKVVLVTGAGGSIGSELCRQIVTLKPTKLILFDISESSLYIIEQEILDINLTNIKISAVIGSVADKNRMEVVFKYYGVNSVFHAAAYKHVPLVESNPSQGVLNNAIGTMSLAQAAISCNIEAFVLISTDKAVRPTNIMGASKRVAELILQALSKQNNSTCFTMVRFGNVLDSSGSVIPLFKKQIKSGGPVTVTHADVVRYFMTTPEAVALVLQAGSLANGGEVFVFDMGEPVLISDLAVKMINLSGLTVLNENNPDGDIEIKYTGLRPGEKLYEELLLDGKFSSTENKMIMRAEEKMISWDKLEPVLCQLRDAAVKSDTQRLFKLLAQIVPEFKREHRESDFT